MAIPNLSFDQVMKRALLLIRNHDKFVNPNVIDDAGNPIYINKLRTFDGFDANSGVTLSIYPYSYNGTSNETVNSSNAAIVFEDFEPGSATRPSRERARMSFVVSLQTLGYNTPTEVLTAPSGANPGLVLEHSSKEDALMKWQLEVADMLLTNPIQNLGGLIHASRVNWGAFHTTQWESKNNAVVHKATLLWHMELYTVRNWRTATTWGTVPQLDPNPTWTYVGIRRSDLSPVYWDNLTSQLVTVSGLVLSVTPKGYRVVWNPTQGRFEDPTTGTPLTSVQLEDPNVSPLGPWIDTNLFITGVMMPSRQNLYWHQTQRQLQWANGKVITQLEDGTPVHFDPVTKLIVNETAGQAITKRIPSFLPISANEVSIYDANGLILKDQFRF